MRKTYGVTTKYGVFSRYRSPLPRVEVINAYTRTRTVVYANTLELIIG